MSAVEWKYTDDEIDKILSEYVETFGHRLAHIEITWSENEYTFDLALEPIFADAPPLDHAQQLPLTLQFGRITTIASVPKYNPENIHNLINAGRVLYYRFRGKYPVKRNLGGPAKLWL